MAGTSKKGKLTRDDKKYILEHAEKDSVQAIAVAISKDPKYVREFILENSLVVPVGEDIAEIEVEYHKFKAEFKKTPEFAQLKQQLTPEEIRYFEHRYVRYLLQFKEDILPSEEATIFLLLKDEILSNRTMAIRQQNQKAIARLTDAVDKYYRRVNNDLSKLSDAERAQLVQMEENLIGLKDSQNASINEWLKLQEKQIQLSSSLKALRSQRIQAIENQKQTMVELLKSLQDEELREREVKEMEIYNLGTQREYERLSQPHQFIDKEIDLPILNADTVKNLDNESA